MCVFSLVARYLHIVDKESDTHYSKMKTVQGVCKSRFIKFFQKFKILG